VIGDRAVGRVAPGDVAEVLLVGARRASPRDGPAARSSRPSWAPSFAPAPGPPAPPSFRRRASGAAAAARSRPRRARRRGRARCRAPARDSVTRSISSAFRTTHWLQPTPAPHALPPEQPPHARNRP
jgi:hypothetical protein